MQVLIQEKLDGISVALTYKDGQLASMITRGDGAVGQDITPNAQLIPSVPKQIPQLGTVHIRGELIMEDLIFQTHFKNRVREGKTGIPNARNTVSGLAASKSTPQDLEHLIYVAYEYWGPHRDNLIKSEFQMINWLRDVGFKTTLVNHLVDSPEMISEFYEEYSKTVRSQLPYQTDGLVLKVNSFQAQSRLGSTGGRPDHAIAIKPPAKDCVTTVLSLEWTPGLSGRFTPLAHVTPTILGGEVTLKAVNMHNAQYLAEWAKLGFDIGATVVVSRAGDVIPYLIGVVHPDGTIKRIKKLEGVDIV